MGKNVDYDLCVYEISKDDIGKKASVSAEMEVLSTKKLTMHVQMDGEPRFIVVLICVMIAELARIYGKGLTKTFAYVAKKYLEILEKHIEDEMIEREGQED